MIRNIVNHLIRCLILAPFLSLAALVEVYSQAGCADCEWVRESFLPEAEARFGTNLESRVWDIAEKENFLRLLGVLDRAGVEDDESVYLVLDGAEVLAALERLSGCPAPPPPADAAPEDVPRRFLDRLTVPAILLAGLADGFNPCGILCFGRKSEMRGEREGRKGVSGLGRGIAGVLRRCTGSPEIAKAPQNAGKTKPLREASVRDWLRGGAGDGGAAARESGSEASSSSGVRGPFRGRRGTGVALHAPERSATLPKRGPERNGNLRAFSVSG